MRYISSVGENDDFMSQVFPRFDKDNILQNNFAIIFLMK